MIIAERRFEGRNGKHQYFRAQTDGQHGIGAVQVENLEERSQNSDGCTETIKEIEQYLALVAGQEFYEF